MWGNNMAEEDKKVCEGSGLLEKKEECLTKKGDKYWKFIIDGKTFSLFEYEAGLGISVGNQVGMYWTETQGDFNGKPITYHNLNSIYLLEDEVVKTNTEAKNTTPSQFKQEKNMQAVKDYAEKDADKFELGMAKNLAGEILCQLVAKGKDIADCKEIIKQNSEYYDLIVEALFNKNKAIRQKILGY